MDGRLLLLLVSVCSPVIGQHNPCTGEKTDVKCPKCQPIRPMKDFDEEKVNNSYFYTFGLYFCKVSCLSYINRYQKIVCHF